MSALEDFDPDEAKEKDWYRNNWEDDMGVRDTSKLAYEEVSPRLGDKQKVVLNTIAKAKRPVNNQEIAIHLALPINTITPRTNELLSLDKVELAFKAIYPATGRKVCYWKVKE